MYSPKSRDWSKLITDCGWSKGHFPKASQPIKDAIDSFCKRLEEEDIVLSNRNSSGYTWKSKSLFKCFCDEFNPALNSLFPINSQAHRLLDIYKISFPLSENSLQKESCRLISNKFREVHRYLDDLLEDSSESTYNKFFEVAESCLLMSEILDRIYTVIGPEKIHWCDFCFRRCEADKNYCDQHCSTNSKAVGTASQSENPAYRKAKRLAKKVPAILLSQWTQHRASRILMGDDFRLMSSVADFAGSTDLARAIVIKDDIKKLVLDTQNTIWDSDLAKRWDLEVSNSFPIINALFSNSAQNFNNWDSYRFALINLLENNYETTSHPYWILLMLLEAEIWFTYEHLYSDLRRTATTDSILDLVKQGLKNTEIATKLNISRQYVSHIKKLYDV